MTRINRVYSFALAALVLVATACTAGKQYYDENQIVGLASPINLEFGETAIVTADYFINPALIDSVLAPAGLTAALSASKEEIRLNGTLAQDADVLEIWLQGYAYHILLKKSSKEEVTLTFNPRGRNYRQVQVKGEFNNWNAASAPLQKKGDIWEVTLLVNKGVYQ